MIDTSPAVARAQEPQPVRTGASTGRLALVVVAAGLGIGVLTEWAQGVLVDPWAMWANSIAVWVLVAFAVGALAGTPRRAAVAGVAVELLLLAGYYAVRTLQDVPSQERILVFWIAGALVGGLVFGVAGSWWRSTESWAQIAGVSLAGGVLVSEGLMRAVAFPWQGASGAIMVAVGIVLTVVIARTARQRWIAPLCLLVAVPLGLSGTWVANSFFLS
ncbi:DUF6518 family protein [Oerskovia flava]|uniref:DUF6518 family protein n=1 Tax=Oerskovia flava TaxID=2986422 RepID=UPI00223E9BF6|nr:DUF6518 family protein [Oerskovia sp. JB1-3-2]